MKRYLVFAGEVEHPQSGWDAFVMATDSASKAIKEAKAQSQTAGRWAEVIDLEVQLPVWKSGLGST